MRNVNFNWFSLGNEGDLSFILTMRNVNGDSTTSTETHLQGFILTMRNVNFLMRDT